MELHELKTRLQAHLSDGLILVVGSGLSCAEGLPGMRDLAAHLCQTIVAESNEAQDWNEIVALIQEKGLEAALLQKAPSQRLEAAISAETGVFFAEAERSVISEVFEGRRTLRLTPLLAHMLKPFSGLPIITTNYDRLIEVAVEEAGLGVDTMFSGRFAGSLNERESHLSFCRNATYKKPRVILQYKTRALVYKPHGSLDWYLRNGVPVSYQGELKSAARLIITPGQNKFRNGYESPFDQHRARANDAIDRASRFLIIGYGFNDDHLETHLSPAIRGGKPTLLLTYELSNSAKDLASKYGNVMAIDREFRDGVEGSRVIIDRNHIFLPKLKLWDVKYFVTEVFEP
ncbi:SIR2 family protein [Pseudoxanthomonas gei]|uniref:SIR2 family protein n=1 Tax=Pseudoxanthomonas gei TaxID=1383030 RepID=A0ABX0AE81_9GAMM|nr:SIR2 family protein [Pseudoxanthomonas gei]NDK37554.1 SIR2 family protein [Pseudoxanthomonas gei]